MAPGKPPLAIIRSPAAIDELHQIWVWNVRNNGLARADAYAQFLADRIAKLAADYSSGTPVDARPDLRYRIVRRRLRGHGHVLVYKFDQNQVRLLHVSHTAQDWDQKLTGEGPG
jgi:plasmid stabilization system protein ParE